MAVFHLDQHGVEIVGEIRSGLPSLGFPDLGLADYLHLVGPAVGVLLIGFAEGLGAAKTYAVKGGYPISPNRELGGLGAANLGSGVLGGMVVNGSLSKTAVNGSAGARSQVSGLVVAALTVLTLVFLTGLFQLLPETVLAAVVIAAVIELVDFASLRRLYRVWTGPLGRIYRLAARIDFIAALGAMLGVLLFDTLPGLFIGISLSLLTLLYRSSRPYVSSLAREKAGLWVDVARNPELERDPRISVVRVESGLFFANADYVRARIEAVVTDRTRAVIVDGETTPFVDVTGAAMLGQLATDLGRRGVELVLARDIGQVRDVMSKAETEGTADWMFPTVDDAYEGSRQRLDRSSP